MRGLVPLLFSWLNPPFQRNGLKMFARPIDKEGEQDKGRVELARGQRYRRGVVPEWVKDEVEVQEAPPVAQAEAR